MKALLFDSGPLITLAMNNLLWIIKPLKEQFRGNFYITEGVRKEVVDVPKHIRRFKFEAIQTEALIKSNTFEVVKKKGNTAELVRIANACYSVNNKRLKIVSEAEIEVISVANRIGCEAIVIDERTVRLLIEDPKGLKKLLEIRLNKKVQMNNEKIKKFREKTKNIKIIRSIELAAVAYKLGLLKKYTKNNELLDAVFWGLKTNGCGVTSGEIEELKKIMQ